MKPEDEIQFGENSGVTRALKALGESDRALEAPPEVEAKLRAAFQSRVQGSRARNRPMRVWRWVPAVAAAAILAIVTWYYRGPRVEPARVAAGVTPGVAPGAVPVIHPQIIHAQPRIIHARATQTATRAQDQQPHEIATDFFPLVDFAAPADGGELVRVSLPASAMREVGLPVREDRLEDRVQADVLVSNGMATAIRFVKNMQ
jgi:hypothetical protein